LQPFEAKLVRDLGLGDGTHLFPKFSSPSISKDISDALQRDTLRYLGSSFSISQWRRVTVSFSDAHRPQSIVDSSHTHIDNQIRGHTNQIAQRDYSNNSVDPAGEERGVVIDRKSVV